MHLCCRCCRLRRCALPLPLRLRPLAVLATLAAVPVPALAALAALAARATTGALVF